MTNLEINFPESLPVSAKRDEIMAAIAQHQVVIVCGETGSGKTTQLPKIALAMGRGACNYPPGQRAKLIGHTQPRRIAATSVAKRIAQELASPLGEVVGYKVRFQDRLSRGASVKLMTDGILLAETQTDPLLQAYDTLIIDEAHERSLNIDFLLGYLRQILPKRPDLKVIVTSATIDAQRFAEHFATCPALGRPEPGDAPVGGSDPRSGGAWGPLTLAPIIMVSGRMFPVEQRYRPFEESRDYDLNHAIADAVDELWRSSAASGPSLAAQGRPEAQEAPAGGSDPRSGGAWGPSSLGDILVFLPGEREIREAAEHLRQHLSQRPLTRHTEVLPLFARLSQAEQERIFDAHSQPRIVLATNVAETSLTVPGIRYVIDAGTVRVKRYSFRNKVEQLLVEPISQSAANQRAGRCGRVSNGICIRLYAQQDFEARPRFSDAEILRSSLAGVILRMKSLRLGAVEDFPFLERPVGRAIADGYQLLHELGALDDANALTPMGQELAHLPLDPRVGRMVLEARTRGALDEVLVIASALSVQDVRDRPMDAQQQADAAHAKFDDEKSEFSGYLRLWQWIHAARGGEGAHKLSNRQYEQLLRQNFINIRRVREWKDIHSQLLTVVTQQQWTRPAQGRPKVVGAPTGGSDPRSGGAWGHSFSDKPASYEQLHLSMLAGLLGNVGCKLEEGQSGEYVGARGIKFFVHPGAHLKKKPGRWIVASELVETTRLFGRGVAQIEPQWIEQVGAHLLKKQVLEPHWEKKAAEVMALERATLYGLVVYSGRRVNYSRLDMPAAREIFIREALVGETLDASPQEPLHTAERQTAAKPDGARTWATTLPFLAANRALIRQVQELEHKARRQDVLVDEEAIYAFYDQHLPTDVCSAYSLERWYREESKKPQYQGQDAGHTGRTLGVRNVSTLLCLTREALMRHAAVDVTTAAFPHTVRLGGVDCVARYLHQPGDAQDGITVTLPLFVLNQVAEERCEWLVPGMLREKVQALLKTLHQRPRSRLVPLPETAAQFTQVLTTPEKFGAGSLVDALLQLVRVATSLDIARTDIKVDMLAPHFFMNFKVVDAHGRQLGQGRNLGALKAEWGRQARGAFQALAQLKLGSSAVASTQALAQTAPTKPAQGSKDAAHSQAVCADSTAATAQTSVASGTRAGQRYTAWTFGVLPELLEIEKAGQTLIGFPALVDVGDAVMLEVFDEPEMALAKHRAGLSRLFALHIKDALKYLEKNIPDMQKMAVVYMQLGKELAGAGANSATLEGLRAQIIGVAVERAFLLDPLPHDEVTFKRRLEEGRGRFSLIAQEVARVGHAILNEYAALLRKMKDNKSAAPALADVAPQLQRLMPLHFLQRTPWARLQHFVRYLKAISLRLDKYRADPARDATCLAQLRPLEQRYWRLVAERKGVVDERMAEFRWMLEELRVSFFAQELRTAQPVSVKRLEKAWAQCD